MSDKPNLEVELMRMLSETTLLFIAHSLNCNSPYPWRRSVNLQIAFNRCADRKLRKWYNLLFEHHPEFYLSPLYQEEINEFVKYAKSFCKFCSKTELCYRHQTVRNLMFNVVDPFKKPRNLIVTENSIIFIVWETSCYPRWLILWKPEFCIVRTPRRRLFTYWHSEKREKDSHCYIKSAIAKFIAYFDNYITHWVDVNPQDLETVYGLIEDIIKVL